MLVPIGHDGVLCNERERERVSVELALGVNGYIEFFPDENNP